jgi:superfamily I DNA and RNA helicase
LAAVLLGVGVAGFALAFLVRQKQREMFTDRPPATGDVGYVAVYAQLASGPQPLQVGRRRQLHRPQDLAFQFSAEGSGPRIIRIELHDEDGKIVVMHEEIVEAPKSAWSLDYVLTLDDEAPDALEIVVALDAPHTRGYASRYPIALTGSSNH